MPELLILRSTQHLLSAEQVGCQVQRLLYSAAYDYEYLSEIKEISPISNVSLSLQVWGPIRLPVRLPHTVTRTVAEYLSNRHLTEDITYDCYAFATEAAGLERHEKAYLLGYWNLEPNPKRLRPGDVAFWMTIAEHRFHHAALYIGHNLYMSVWGMGGQLEVTTRSAIQHIFEGPDFFKATPLHTA